MMERSNPAGANSSTGAARHFQPVVLCSIPFLVIGLLASGSPALTQDSSQRSEPAIVQATYIGSRLCAQCHASEHADWLASQHRSAMQEANESTVLGDFNNATFSKDSTESTFFKTDGKYWVRTEGPDGKLADFQIRYTFGVAPLQQYLIELHGGRLQALGIAWDARDKQAGGQRWYDLYPDRPLSAGDPLHWTGIDQNWNYQCGYCHSTNLRKNYQPASREFKTTWSEISIGCEACHGPASKHVEWARVSKGSGRYEKDAKGFALSLDERKGVTWQAGDGVHAKRSVPRVTSKEMLVCAACHSRRQQFSDDPGDVSRYSDAFRLSRLEAGLYHSDGQQRDEVYTHGSFVQSKMYAAGVTCSDCHNPHSGKLRLTGNAVCSQCHLPEQFDSPIHHHHASGSDGARCGACHMPTTTYMGVDSRHDHSMRIPRPDRSVILATPNACNQCHADKSATWASDAVKTWYAAPKPGAQDFAEAFDLGDRRAPGAQAALMRIATAETSSALARASALTRLGRLSSQHVIGLAAQSLKIEDPSVRSAAVAVIADADPTVRRALLVPLLRDSSRVVRMDAARALVGQAADDLSGEDREHLESALSEYVEAELFNAERPESHANLGTLYREQGKIAEARREFEEAIKIDPSFFAASVSLADMIRVEGNESEAEQILNEARARNPGSGPILHALGLSLIRQQRVAEAMTWLEKAANAAPDEPRFSYVLAVALHDTGKKAEAIGTLKNALARHPYDRDILWALATYEFEAQAISSALERAQLLNRLEPDRPDIAQFLATLRQRAR